MKYNRLLCYIVLGIWTLSLLQFTLVLTASKARRDQAGIPSSANDFKGPIPCCNPELYGILTSIMLQDLPFLCVRLMLIFKYHVVSYTNFFFTSKNSLVIILLIYRLIVVHTVAKKQSKEERLSITSSTPNIFETAYPRKVSGGGRRANMKLSTSTPSVYALYANNPRNGHISGKHSTSNYQLPTNKGSDENLKQYMTNNNRHGQRLGLPVEMINEKSGGSVGCIKAI